MNFRCAKCRVVVPIPNEVVEGIEGATVECPNCGARYRRRKKPASDEAEAAPTAGTSSSQGMTAATKPPTIPTVVLPHTSPPIPTSNPISAPSSPPPVSPTPAAPPEAKQTFAPQQLVAGRYRIVRFVAKGGMGEVYEAEDLELGEQVALKTVRSRTAGSQVAIERLKREIQLARKVTHPNICRIFDVGRHQAPGGNDTVFLTMEFLHGETLTQHLKANGPLTEADALPIIRQMAAGLSAAHGAAVVHRDLKSDNVMLVPGKDGLRAVVTDFGVARATSGSEADAIKVTTARDVVGTPAYMAPEQVAGGEITGATDVYAFGVVIYEMVTGKVPFVSDTPLATAAMRLTDDPPSPRLFRPDLNPRWEQAILRCLEREAEARFAGEVEEVAKFLAGEDSETLAQAAEAQLEAFKEEKLQAVERAKKRTLAEQETKQRAAEARRQRRQRASLVLAIVLVLTASYLFATRVVEKLNETPTLAGLPAGNIRARHAVAVLGFRNVAAKPELAWLSTALAEMLRTELVRGGELRLIPGENVARMRAELALAEVDSLATDTLLKIRDILGTDYVVLGSYIALSGGNLRLDLRLQDASSGETLAAVAENGSEAELFDIVVRSGERLRESLNLVSAATAPVASALPTDPEAARLYAEGLDYSRRFDPLTAHELLAKAAEAAPDNALVHAALASTLADLGYQHESLEVARKAFDLSRQLPEEERLAIEGFYREAAKQWERASQIYEALWRSFPDNLEYGLRHAATLTAAGRGTQALATIDVLRSLPAPASEDPRIDLAEASAAISLAQFARQQEAAARAASKASQLGAVLLVAEAKVTEAEALRHLGRTADAQATVAEARKIYDELDSGAGQTLAMAEEANIRYASGDYGGARELYEQSRRMCDELGDQGCVLRAVNNLAVVLRNLGELAAAKERYAEVLELARQLRSRLAEVNALNNLGAVLYTEGQLAAAKGRFEESLNLSRELGQRSTEAFSVSNLAVVRREQGFLDQAEGLHQQALNIRRELGQLPGEAASLNHLGTVALLRGELDQAEERFSEALAKATEVKVQRLRADALHNLGLVYAHRELTVEAREHFEEARKLLYGLGEKRSRAKTDLALASLAIDERTPELAAASAQKLADELGAARADDESAMAYVVLSRAHLELGEVSAAETAVATAAELVRESEKRRIDLDVRLQLARVLLAADRPQDAKELLQPALSQAEGSGLLSLQLEARLLLGQVELALGRTAAARAQLLELEREARSRGYENLALRTAEATPR